MIKGLSPLSECLLRLIEAERGYRMSIDGLFYKVTEECNFRKLSKKKLMVCLRGLEKRGDIRIRGKVVYFVKS